MRIRVRNAAGEPTWPQLTVAAFTPSTGARVAYKQTGGAPATFEGLTPGGDPAQLTGLKFGPGGSESFDVAVPAGGGLVLRKGYFLDETGQEAEVLLDGKPAGAWNLSHGDKELSGGVREALYVVDQQALAGKAKLNVEVRYPKGGNTTHWIALEYRGGPFPITAVGSIHANQTVGAPRPGRNIVGSGLKIGDKPFANGLGKGSVVFEVYGDGKKLWASPVMSGLDAAKSVDLPVEGVDRLRLVVTDAGDGNRFDAADWCNAALHLP